jgi:hypothetical protein
VGLGGQAVAPESFAKVYWNQDTKVVYVDLRICQNHQKEWYISMGIKTKSFNTTSIGLLENFDKMIKNYLL